MNTLYGTAISTIVAIPFLVAAATDHPPLSESLTAAGTATITATIRHAERFTVAQVGCNSRRPCR